jgi:hypothetical protein
MNTARAFCNVAEFIDNQIEEDLEKYEKGLEEKGIKNRE